MPMKYTIQATWNGAIVLRGESTAVMAHAVLENVLIDDFAGDTARKARVEHANRLAAIGRMLPGQRLDFVTADETGRATFSIEKVEK